VNSVTVVDAVCMLTAYHANSPSTPLSGQLFEGIATLLEYQ